MARGSSVATARSRAAPRTGKVRSGEPIAQPAGVVVVLGALENVAASIELASTDVHIFLCGPLAMVKDLTRDLRRHGLPPDYIHFEHLSFR